MERGSTPVSLRWDGVLLCPKESCRQYDVSYLHQSKFEITFRKEGETVGSDVVVDRSSVTFHQHAEPECDIARIHFVCEFCGETQILKISQHKGFTFMCWGT